MKIIDSHIHIGLNNIDETLAEMSRAGISRVISSPLPLADSAEEIIQSNTEALELYRRYPEFYLPAVIVHPAYHKESLKFLNEFVNRGLFWAGEWLSYKCNIEFDRAEWEPLFRFAAKNDMVVQMHNHESVAVIARRYPELTIVASHLNPDVLPLLTDLPNVVLDISGLHGGLVRTALKDAVKLFGSKRLLFGTDYPGYDPEPFVLRCKRDIPAAELDDVFSGNVTKILRAHKMI